MDKTKKPQKDISVGVFYGLQENENREKVTSQFNSLTTQINELKRDSRIILMGDFNAKLAFQKTHSSQHESANGKLLEHLLKETNTRPTTSEEGTWTRVNRKHPDQKSVIDYVLVENDDNLVSDLVIDEVGIIRPFSSKLRNGTVTKTETDHNTITMKVTTSLNQIETRKTCWKHAEPKKWKDFNIKLQKKVKLSNISNPNDLTDAILTCLKQTIGRKTISNIPTIKESKQIKEARQLKKTQEKNSTEIANEMAIR